MQYIQSFFKKKSDKASETNSSNLNLVLSNIQIPPLIEINKLDLSKVLADIEVPIDYKSVLLKHEKIIQGFNDRRIGKNYLTQYLCSPKILKPVPLQPPSEEKQQIYDDNLKTWPLPEELTLQIFLHCDTTTILNLMLTCRYFLEIVGDLEVRKNHRREPLVDPSIFTSIERYGY